VFGDVEGASQLIESAYTRTRAEETEDRAWLLTQLAHLRFLIGKTAEAEKLLVEALRLFPGYHYALANMAKVREAQGEHVKAAELLKERYSAAPHPENLYDLAASLNRAGKSAEAKEAFTQFERDARAEMKSRDNANRELIFYYTDHAGKPAEALRVATLEIGRRRDVRTLDAYAWALQANGRNSEARKQIEAALAVGTRDPRILHHAEAIAGKK
jgi:tetratricopeptide (TPR) repeat protein